MNDEHRPADGRREDRDPGDPAAARFARAAGELLRDSADHLDAATRSRLNRARQRALDALPPPRTAAVPRWVPVAAAAAVAGLAVVLIRPGADQPPAASVVAESAAAPADLELLLAAGSGDELEMVAELEFYAWLDADRSPAELQAELDGVG